MAVIVERALGGHFQTVRFVRHGYSAFQMREIAEGLLDKAMRRRILAGLDATDAPAPPLTPKYAKFKRKIGQQPIRNWRMTGNLMRDLQVTSATDNKAIIGFTSGRSNAKAFYNNRIIRQFAVSPRDSVTLKAEFGKQPAPVRAEVV
jgi:hypothetical protein